MGSIKKALGAVVLTSVLVAGGFAASVALASGGSTGWTAGSCSAGAHDVGARTKTIAAIYSGVDANGLGCSLTVQGKFSVLPAKNVAVMKFVHIAASPASGTYTGTIKTPTFNGTLTLATAVPMTITNGSGCGWTYAWIGGQYVALFTTC